MKKTALLVMIITVLSKIIGFGREIVLSYVYGASAITDAYLISQTIPIVIFSFIGVGIATSFIPLYSRIFNEQGQLEANRYTNNLSNTLLLRLRTHYSPRLGHVLVYVVVNVCVLAVRSQKGVCQAQTPFTINWGKER